MKTLKMLVPALFLLGSSLAFAAGKGNSDWADQAARSYEKKAAHAADQGQPENAAIYKRMAQIKREAGAASKKGKDFDWSEYYELKGKLNHGKTHKSAKDKKYKKKVKDKKHAKDKDYKKSKKAY
jgi:hypothetical protein